MEPEKVIVCPAYLITDAQNGTILTMSSQGTYWFPVYHTLDIAKQRAELAGGEYSIRTVNDVCEFHTILESNPEIAGFLVNNPAQTNFFQPVERRELLGD